MKKIRIGIPRALLYYRYGVLWKKFFEKMNCKVILSPETNNDILKLGIQNTSKDNCLSYKIYLGHILYLKDKCDYILISNICNYGNNDKVCPVFSYLYDNIKFLIPPSELISYRIDHKNYYYEFFEIFKLGYKINHNPIRIIYSYLIAKRRQKHYDINKEQAEKNKLFKPNRKVLLVSYEYNIKDKFISSDIIDTFNENNITVIYADSLNKELSALFADYFMDDLDLKYSKEIIGSIYYYRYQINGIVFIATANCHIDNIINNLAIIKNSYLPTLNIIIDEENNKYQLDNNIQSFIMEINNEE